MEDERLVSTVSGRMSSGSFDFQIDTKSGVKKVCVANSQIEIDAAYEGINYLSLFEAKRELPHDFLIRQLYYPFRVWQNRVTKPVKSVFLTFSNGLFSLYQYQFENPFHYNSLKLVKQKNYMIGKTISISDIENLLKTVSEVQEPEISFPQADNMDRIINLMELLYEKSMTRNEITTEYAFTVRQTDYYTHAGMYLGLIEKKRNVDNSVLFQLSKRGRCIMNLTYKERQLAIVSQILEHRVFRETLKLHLHKAYMPDRQTIVEIMKSSNIYHVGEESTYFRRASTVTSWIDWILSIIDDE